jgi:HPt (histidine-containing phosphotransfer) domain-containing protein
MREEGGDPSAVVDLEGALETVGGDEELLREVVEVFLEEDYPRQLAVLREGLASDDAKKVGDAAHGIKGALASFGGRAGCDLALELEKMGNSQSLNGAGELAQRLEREVRRLAAFFERTEAA